jgi:CubicO group peptidase (beta-lactamase class C family)
MPASELKSETETRRIFDADTVELFSERQGPEGSSFALGWDTPSENSSSGHHFSPRSIGHLGYSGCSLWIDREARVAVALLTNRTWPDRKSQLIRESGLLFTTPFERRFNDSFNCAYAEGQVMQIPAVEQFIK